ncbi:Uncharacterised protein [Exiguobacterium aurantiacum]|uniref:Uncharacterized protein n=1 Tax=Exiguobacterium aurantiacum TaxID=33987 RepID=A0A377FQK2_9BACL|nr:Uncharacterised protein [Exiguobacterium aurantiacum]STO08885.1 Uncharacterised protein [Exiguobacterium aurantiacum]
MEERPARLKKGLGQSASRPENDKVTFQFA